MTTARELLAARIRTVLAGEPTTREVSMFGGTSFMVDGAMAVAAQREGDLLVHVDPTRHAQLLARPGARQAEMGAGREMGPGWISVSAGAITSDAQLSAWVSVALTRRTTAGG